MRKSHMLYNNSVKRMVLRRRLTLRHLKKEAREKAEYERIQREQEQQIIDLERRIQAEQEIKIKEEQRRQEQLKEEQRKEEQRKQQHEKRKRRKQKIVYVEETDESGDE